ncbi:MFS transporter [Thermococcus sp.]|uniref:MFS transporter n=1 Tax=Thermococcus sp. TaxID=35749 RepID=UPI002606DC74|nr:MFS transporter [Thermococcus sp.]
MGTRDIWFLHASTFLFFLGMAVVNPIISPFVINLGADPLLVGTVAAVASIVSLMFKPFGGFLGDRGLKFHMMALGSLLGAVGGVLYMISAFSSNLWIFAFGRAVHGFGMALFFPSSLASAIDLAPEGEVGATLGWRGMMFSMGNLVGPGIGGYAAQFFGFNAVFALTVTLSIAAIAFVFAAYRRTGVYVSTGGEGRRGKADYRHLLMPFFVAASLALFFMSFTYGGLMTFLPAFYAKLGFGTGVFGLYASVMGGASLVTRVFGGKEADRRGPLPVVTVGLFMVLLSYVALDGYMQPPMSYISAILLGAGFGFAVPALQVMALARLPQGIRTVGSGIYTMFFDLGYLSGPIILGYVAKVRGYSAVFPILPFILLASLLVAQLPRFLRESKELGGG